MKQIAFSKVIMPSGQILHREVVVFNEEGKAIRHFPLIEEIPFCEWHDTIFNWVDEY